MEVARSDPQGLTTTWTLFARFLNGQYVRYSLVGHVNSVPDQQSFCRGIARTRSFCIKCVMLVRKIVETSVNSWRQISKKFFVLSMFAWNSHCQADSSPNPPYVLSLSIHKLSSCVRLYCVQTRMFRSLYHKLVPLAAWTETLNENVFADEYELALAILFFLCLSIFNWNGHCQNSLARQLSPFSCLCQVANLLSVQSYIAQLPGVLALLKTYFCRRI